MMIGDKNTEHPRDYWLNPGATPGEYLYESNGIRRGMSTITWIMDLLGSDIVSEAEKRGMTREDYLNHLARRVPAGCDGLYTVLHWLARPDHPHERGMMVGFNGTHGGPHMFRSVMEGIAMTMKNNAQAMCDELGAAPSRIIVSGGGSNGDLFMQIFADVFGVPAQRNVINGSAGLGAAICTALALGIYPSRRDAVDNMVRIRDTFDPIPENVSLYREINETVYRHLPGYTDEPLRRSHEIFARRKQE